MMREMRDIDIRSELHKNYLSIFESDHKSRVISELGICQGNVKIDIAVINSSFWGYEIKSEKDNLKRLPIQINYYNQVFDYLNIVTNDNHLSKIEDLLPNFWGIMLVKKFGDDCKIEQYRKPKRNLNTDIKSQIQLLWKDEALELLSEHQLDKGMKSKPRKILWQTLTQNLPKEKLSEHIREVLKSRTKWR